MARWRWAEAGTRTEEPGIAERRGGSSAAWRRSAAGVCHLTGREADAACSGAESAVCSGAESAACSGAHWARRAAELLESLPREQSWSRPRVVVFFFTLHYGPATRCRGKENCKPRDSVLNIGPGSRHLNQPWYLHWGPAGPHSANAALLKQWLRRHLSATAAPANAARPSPRSCSRQCSTSSGSRRSGRTRSFAPGEEGSTGARGRRWPPRRSNAECSRLTSEPSSGICSSWCAAGL